MQSDRRGSRIWQGFTDIRRHWIDQLLPAAWRPYALLARLDRPIGTWLLLFPCWWSITLAAGMEGGGLTGPLDYWYLYPLFAVGALLMRAAGCTINDILDRDFDAKVERTAQRPLPSGQISLKQAFLFLVALLGVSLLILLQLNGTTILLGVISLLLVVPYPLMKRITYWPQAWLGLTFNWGALMGWTAVAGELSWPPLLLYIAGVFWTLGYDTIYAHQDKEDDALVGVKSSALRLGDKTRPALIGFFTLAFALMLSAGLSSGLSPLFAVAMIPLAIHFAWQVVSLELKDPALCLRLFQSNRHVGWLLLLAILLTLSLA